MAPWKLEIEISALRGRFFDMVDSVTGIHPTCWQHESTRPRRRINNRKYRLIQALASAWPNRPAAPERALLRRSLVERVIELDSDDPRRRHDRGDERRVDRELGAF